jgi:NADP-dependent 3-hydroxy acid dehydrogenase YdfG
VEHTVTERPLDWSVGENQRRSVIVTGASTGIGRATATRLARAGHLVALGARRIDVCEKLAADLRAEGATAFAAHLDLSDPTSIDTFVETAGYLVGSVDVLVSDTNIFGAQHLAARLIPRMVKAGSGDLIFVSPDVIGEPARALRAWVDVVRAELEGTGVRSSIVRHEDLADIIGSVLRPGRTRLRLIEVVASAPRTMEATN